jgi:hypothetical protein
MALSSSRFKRFEASSKVSIWSSDLSANVNEGPSLLSIGTIGCAGFHGTSADDSGSEWVSKRSAAALGTSEISP